MYVKKIIRLKPEQMKMLTELEKEINANGGEINTTKLIRDSINIFLEYFRDEAIEKYSGKYEFKMEEKP
jgi:hypothetical protein